MINLSKSGNTIVFEFVNNGHYLQNGTIEVPVNSLTLVTDGSDMFTFKKSATNDIFVSGLYSEIGMTKSELETFYKENMVGSTGGGGVPESAFTAYTASTDSRIAEDEEVTAAALNALNEEISGKVDTSAFTAYSATVETALSGKQDTLSAGTNITISGNVISAEGGGKAIEAGRGISVTTGTTADTVSFNLPISAGTGSDSIIMGSENNIASGTRSFAGGGADSILKVSATKSYAFAYGTGVNAKGQYSAVFGSGNSVEANGAFAAGYNNLVYGNFGVGLGQKIISNNDNEVSLGVYNASNKANTTWGDSGNTLFSVGNGTANNARHNAFEIRQNGDIYLSSGGTDIKLQDYLGGSSITVDTALDSGSTNPVENRVIYNKIDDIEDRIAEDEEVTAAALNALNDTIGNINSILESI